MKLHTPTCVFLAQNYVLVGAGNRCELSTGVAGAPEHGAG